MSQLAGAPVRLQFMRWDEHGWDNYGPAQLADIRGGVDANGKIVAYRVHGLRRWPRIATSTTDDAAGRHRRSPHRAGRASTRRNSGTQYDIPNRRVIGKSLPLFNNYFKTSTLRAPQAPQTRFALGAVDRRARLRGEDGPVPVPPAEHHARPTRTAGVTCSSASRSSRTGSRRWPPRTCRTRNVVTRPRHRARQLRGLAGRRRRRHRGQQEDRQDPREARVRDAGRRPRRLRPRALESQMVGSHDAWARAGAATRSVAFNKKRVTSLDWVSYPILRFKDHPNITYDRRAALGPAVRAAPASRRHAADPCRDRQRVLRRDGRAHPGGADDARPACARC